ncbi:MAG TPA: glycosyl hydrolase family 8 [Mycobacteriales bacterium]|nr:glycosyl hydrolase family 8 [Mycobacteriales bacterium]
MAALVALLLATSLSGCGGNGKAALPSSDTLADRFLDTYVTGNGAVVRTDQGGDVVSEGQAYAMVLADLAGRSQTVQTVWSWTRTHLQRTDGLLSWHAKADGTVLDPQSAADADVLAAWALLDYRGPGQSALATAGRRLAAAVLAHETVRVDGQLVLAAGTWATTGAAAMVDPSYWMPSVFRALGSVTGDHRWTVMADTSVQMLERLTADGRRLPPDWARLDGSRLRPAGAPGTQDRPAYGQDAARTLVWQAVDCAQTARHLAARWWPLVRGHPAALTRGLDGAVVTDTAVPLSAVAASLSARAAGDVDGARATLALAVAQAGTHPTYYGAAWAALGVAMFDGRAPAC